MIIRNNDYPDGLFLKPDRRKLEHPSCTTRKMTAAEWERYGERVKVEREMPPKMAPEKLLDQRQRDTYTEFGIMPPEVIALSERIKAIREEHHLRQADIAGMAGVSQKTISDLEALRRFPRPKTVKMVEECLKRITIKRVEL